MGEYRKLWFTLIGVLAAIDPARMIYGVLEAAISLTLFVAALLYTRWSYQYERKAAGEA